MDILTYIIIGIVLLAIIGLAVYYIIKFLKMSNDEKKEFLLPLIKGFVAEAEKKIGAGHGSEKFKIVEDNEEFIIATTRPELLPAIVCVFVNPMDDANNHLIGKTI